MSESPRRFPCDPVCGRELTPRHVRPGDCDRVTAVMEEWWDGAAPALPLPHVFFSHLASTSFVLYAHDGVLVGFLLGFLSQAEPDEARVHAVGVHPSFRRLGFGRRLSEMWKSAARRPAEDRRQAAVSRVKRQRRDRAFSRVQRGRPARPVRLESQAYRGSGSGSRAARRSRPARSGRRRVRLSPAPREAPAGAPLGSARRSERCAGGAGSLLSG